MLATLISISLLGLLIIVHEAGHMLYARWMGVKILRFSIGFGPLLLRWTRGDTEYAVSAIPLGGYVKMAGEQELDETHSPKPGDYLSKSVAARAGIVFAGPFVNYLVACLALWVVFIIGYPEMLPVVGRLQPNMPAQTAGIQLKDRVRVIDGVPVNTWDEMTAVIHQSAGRPLSVVVDREGAAHTLTVTPRMRQITDPFGRKKQVGLIGVGPSGAFESLRFGPVEAFGRSFKKLHEWSGQTLLGLWSVATGRMPMRESMTGPIGIIILTSEAVKAGIAPLLLLISLFSLSLAIFNLFPVPVLDGGHLLFLFLERLRGKPVSLTIQGRSAQVGLALLIALVVTVCANDLSRFGFVDKVKEWFIR